MKTHLYKVQKLDGPDSLTGILQTISLLPLDRRVREIESFPYQVEEVVFEQLSGRDLALINFTKLRLKQGPGRGGKGKRTTGFQLAQDEGFSEETAALFDLTKGYLVCEYNHHGARINALVDYLERVDASRGNRLEVLPCLDDDAVRRLGKKQILSKFEVKLAPKNLTLADKASVSSLNGGIAFGEFADAPSISIIVGGVPGRRARLRGGVMNIIKALLKVIEADELKPRDSEKAVLALKVVGKDDDKAPAELLDLVEGRVFGTHLIAAGSDRRFPLGERWNALRRDHQNWKDSML